MTILLLAPQSNKSAITEILPSATLTPASNDRTTRAPRDPLLRHRARLNAPYLLVRSSSPISSCRRCASPRPRHHRRVPNLQPPLSAIPGSKGLSPAHHRLCHFLLNTVVTSAGLENRRNHLGVDLQSRQSLAVDASW
jgi:hypothetical protein